MANTIKGTAGTPSISAMELRSQPGTVLDRVYYRGESVIIKRAGKPRAVIVPVREYEELARRKRQARERFFVMTDELRKKFAKEKPQEVEKRIKEVIKEVRRENAPKRS